MNVMENICRQTDIFHLMINNLMHPKFLKVIY